MIGRAALRATAAAAAAVALEAGVVDAEAGQHATDDLDVLLQVGLHDRVEALVAATREELVVVDGVGQDGVGQHEGARLGREWWRVVGGGEWW